MRESRTTRVLIFVMAMMAMAIAFPVKAKASDTERRNVTQEITEAAPPTIVIIADPKVPAGIKQASTSLFIPVLVGGALLAQLPVIFLLSKRRMTTQES